MTNQQQLLDTNDFNSGRNYHLRGDVSDVSVHAIVKNILKHNEEDKGKSYSSRKPIKLNIESYGGGVNEGLSLVSTILESQTPVYTFCRGRAMSMGFFLFISGHKRFVSRYASLMYHDVSGGLVGKAEAMVKSLEQSVRLRDYLISLTLETTNIKKETLDKYVTLKEEWYLTSSEALELGVADELITEFRNENRHAEENGLVENNETYEEPNVNDAKNKLDGDDDMKFITNLDGKE